MSQHHHYRSPIKRGLISLAIVSVVMIVGAVGMHVFEKMPWTKAFYAISMIATAQGLSMTPQTDAGLIFVSVMSFISVGTVVAALGFLFGPFFGVLWRIGLERFEGEIHPIKKDKSPRG